MVALTNTQLTAKVLALENKLAGTQHNATNGAAQAAAALPKTGGTITGNLLVTGTVNWEGEAGGQAGLPAGSNDFQGTWNGKSLTGAQLQLLSTFHQMNAIAGGLPTDPNSGSNWATGERAYLNNLITLVNALIGELINSNYMV